MELDVLSNCFNIDDSSWQEEMDLVSKLIEEANVLIAEPLPIEFSMEHTGVGLKYKLSNTVTRNVGVQHSPAAKVIKKKMSKPCKKCCCYSHCHLNEHGRGSQVVEIVDSNLDYECSHLLDRSWQEFEEFEEEINTSHAMEVDPLISLFTAVNTDLGM